MDKMNTSTAPAEYEVSGTKYIVIPVYNDHANKEAIEDKIRRLILADNGCKGLKL